MQTNPGLCSIRRAVEVGCELRSYWFRGQPKEYGNLVPRAFRTFEGRERERQRVAAFQRLAPALAEDLPASDELLDWLVLMQHHQLPTRLLDWSESALVGLYFAVNEHFDSDGELWALKHLALSSVDARRGEDDLRTLLQGAFEEHPDLEVVTPLGLHPRMRFSRMVSQQSVFTIHPKEKILPSHAPVGLEAAEISVRHWLVRYLIPAHSKRKLLRDLTSLGVTRRTLFPDLDSLSRTIVEEAEYTVEDFLDRAGFPEPGQGFPPFREENPPSWDDANGE